MKTYSEKLQHPKWQMKRLEILKRDGAKCQFCGDDESMLQVHHKKYIKGNEPWEAPDDDLITTCFRCHPVLEYFKDGDAGDVKHIQHLTYKGMTTKYIIVVTDQDAWCCYYVDNKILFTGQIGKSILLQYHYNNLIK